MTDYDLHEVAWKEVDKMYSCIGCYLSYKMNYNCIDEMVDSPYPPTIKDKLIYNIECALFQYLGKNYAVAVNCMSFAEEFVKNIRNRTI